jgi:2-iminobutanoate/2-iminopropanoate deaminase
MTMARRAIRTDAAPAPVAGAPYSQAIGVAAGAGEIVWISGQVPLDAAGTLAGVDVATQSRQCLANIAAILAAAGGTMADVVKTTVYMTDLDAFGEMNTVYGEAFGQPPPARATIGVAALPAGAAVEIEAVAVLAGTP